MATRDEFTVTGHDIDTTALSAETGLSRAITAANASTRRGDAASYYVRDLSGNVVGQVIADGAGGVPAILGPAYFAAGGRPQDGPPEPLPTRPASQNGKEPDMAPSTTEVTPDPKEKPHEKGPKKEVGGKASTTSTDGKATTEGSSKPSGGKPKQKPKASTPSAPKAETAKSSDDGKAKKVPAKQAAVEVLKKEGGPLHVDELVKRVIATKGVKLGGKTPNATIAAMLAVENKKSDGLFVRTDKATYALR